MEEKVVQPTQSPAQVTPTPQAQDVPPAEQEGVKKEEAAVDPKTLTEEQIQELIPTDHYLTSPLFHEICQFLSIEPKAYDEAKDKVSVITEWAIRNTGSNKFEDIITAIRGLENRIQPPMWGEKRYTNVFKYLRLEMQKEAVSKAMRAFEK